MHARQFTDIVAAPDDQVDLAEAALLIARAEYPGLDVDRYLRRMEDLAASVAERGARDPAARVHALNEVLDRRTGIPITLSTLYIEVGRRAGILVEGVGLPGHFVVRAEGRLVDPFHGGAFLTEDDCQKRLDRIYGGRLKLDEKMLAPCDRKAILARTLRNLKAIYVKAEDHPRALAVVDLIIGLEPAALEERRDRALLHAALDCYALAAGELEDYLREAGNVPGAEQLRQRAAELRARAARVN